MANADCLKREVHSSTHFVDERTRPFGFRASTFYGLPKRLRSLSEATPDPIGSGHRETQERSTSGLWNGGYRIHRNRIESGDEVIRFRAIEKLDIGHGACRRKLRGELQPLQMIVGGRWIGKAHPRSIVDAEVDRRGKEGAISHGAHEKAQ